MREDFGVELIEPNRTNRRRRFQGGRDLLPLGSISQYVPGETYDWPEYDGCVYEDTAEALSR